jgi:HSP20 family protein
MAKLTRYDPFREMVSLRDVMDRLVQDAMVSPGTFSGQLVGSAPMDVSEDDDAYDVTLSLPGWKADEIGVSLQQDTVTVSGQRKPDEGEGKAGETFHMRERRFAAFSRSFTFPTPVDPEKVDAKFENGELTLRLPKAESARPRQIKIGSGGKASGSH